MSDKKNPQYTQNYEAQWKDSITMKVHNPKFHNLKTRQISYEYFTTVPECNFYPGKSVSVEASDTRKQ